MGKILTEMENIINDISQNDISKETEFECLPEEDGSYKVILGGDEVCKVMFENSIGKMDDLETAQMNPQDYVVYIFNVNEIFGAKEFKSKLESMGFESISMGE